MDDAALSEFTFHMSTRVRFGTGSLAHLPDLVEELGGSRASVFLITGRQNLRHQGTLDRVLTDLNRFHTVHYDQALPFPSPELVDRTVESCHQAAPDVVVAIGGGSALDLGKLVAILMTNPGPSLDYATGHKHIENRGLPFIAVPTTSGSSSEVTLSAAMWQMDQKLSYRVRHSLMFPTIALVDPDLAMSMPRALAAAAGMDAFTSAFESYWSVESQPMTDALALEVIRLYSRNLEASCRNGDRAARTNCSLAATVSGVGYINSRPNVCHAFSRPLTLLWGIAHGEAVGVSLPACLEWNAQAIPEKLPALWDTLDVGGLEEAQESLTNLMETCGLHTRLSQMGVTGDSLETFLDYVPWERLAKLPRSMSRAEAGSLLEGLL